MSNQNEYNKKWRDKNPEYAKYLRSRTNARTFVRKYAKKEDVIELIEIFRNENEEGKNFSI